MGCSQAKLAFTADDSIPGQTEEAYQLMLSLGFESQQIDKLFDIFCSIDVG